MKIPNHLARNTFVIAGLAAAAWIGFALVLGWNDIAGAIRQFGARTFALVVLLSLANYGLRFLRWGSFLATVGAVVPPRSSFAIYFATYVMVITPGKLGEAFKAGVLRDRHGIALARGLPVVLAERIYDFLAVLALVGGGMVFWDGPWHGAELGLSAGIVFAGLLLVVRSPALRRRLVARAAASRQLGDHRVALDDSLAALSDLLAPRQGTIQLAVSILAWFCECVGMWLVCRALAPQVGLGDAVFVYAAGTLVGSLSFLPGGLGSTEAAIIALLGTLGVAVAAATVVAFIVRLATLWLAVLFGLAVFAVFRREILAPRAPSP